MRLKNVLIAVKDVERSRKFYRDLFGLETILNQEGNAILTEGLVLQDRRIWQECLGKEIAAENHASELYFEEKEIEKFVEKLESGDFPVVYVTKLMQYPSGKKIVRFYDPDGNLIEVGTPM